MVDNFGQGERSLEGCEQDETVRTMVSWSIPFVVDDDDAHSIVHPPNFSSFSSCSSLDITAFSSMLNETLDSKAMMKMACVTKSFTSARPMRPPSIIDVRKANDRGRSQRNYPVQSSGLSIPSHTYEDGCSRISVKLLALPNATQSKSAGNADDLNLSFSELFTSARETEALSADDLEARRVVGYRTRGFRTLDQARSMPILEDRSAGNLREGRMAEDKDVHDGRGLAAWEAVSTNESPRLAE
ncbi:hypothetical protein SCHPADRAFT_887771 [Schizopora paradoxa]|uniref:Uncharacterized protein n=1 Tax=Schizopora paradoxa TaxID=27342 RepID=A0A0H2RXE6_9AGAM|nr:hypothetical protein SCHPADRAFT_887771 [Schizopora paradoxa]